MCKWGGFNAAALWVTVENQQQANKLIVISRVFFFFTLLLANQPQGAINAAC